MKLRRIAALPLLGLLMALLPSDAVAQNNPANAAPGKILYENNFEKAALDKVPDEFLVLADGFAVKHDETNRFLELPGAPLESFGALFGPTLESEMAVTARMRGTAKGRRYPTFALGLNGVSGYRLEVAPAKNALELYRGDVVVAQAPFQEKMGPWMNLRLQVRKKNDAEWTVEGKVWPEGSKEPEPAQIIFAEKTKPIPGRATLWGCPYAGTPIQFDDLRVTGLGEK